MSHDTGPDPPTATPDSCKRVKPPVAAPRATIAPSPSRAFSPARPACLLVRSPHAVHGLLSLIATSDYPSSARPALDYSRAVRGVAATRGGVCCAHMIVSLSFSRTDALARSPRQRRRHYNFIASSLAAFAAGAASLTREFSNRRLQVSFFQPPRNAGYPTAAPRRSLARGGGALGLAGGCGFSLGAAVHSSVQ